MHTVHLLIVSIHRDLCIPGTCVLMAVCKPNFLWYNNQVII